MFFFGCSFLAQLGCLTNFCEFVALNFFPTIRGDSSSDDFMGLFRANGGFCCSFVHVKKRPVSGRSDQTKENAEKKNTLFDFLKFFERIQITFFNSRSTNSGKLCSTSSLLHVKCLGLVCLG